MRVAEFKELQRLFNRACEVPSYEDYVKLQEAMLVYLGQVPSDSCFLEPWKESLKKHVEELRRFRVIACPDCQGEGAAETNFCPTCHGRGEVMITIQALR